jgi:APA family basic amino acid/polyamine antiporter
MAVHDEAGLYVRQATGLVRAAGKWSVLVYNIMFVSIGLMTLFAISTIPAFYPGSNIQLSFVLALVIVLPTSMVFAMLSVAMPRSGGDYVYVSRALGPAWGMMSNWNQTVWWILYGGVPSAFFAYYGLTPLLRSLGVLTNQPDLITWGDRLSTPTGAFLTGAALIIILVVIFATGLNFYGSRTSCSWWRCSASCSRSRCCCPRTRPVSRPGSTTRWPVPPGPRIPTTR